MQETQETWVPSLGPEDPLQEEMATHSTTFAWRIPWTEEPGGLHTVHGVAESDRTERLSSCFGHETHGISALQPGIKSTLPGLEGEVLTAGPPGKSQEGGSEARSCVC
ncbi:hypothetical protein R6Z07F_009575 [Ovis aries]